MQLAEKTPFDLIDGGRITPFEAAKRWAEKGYHVIPIPFRQKRPEILEWQTLRLKPADLPGHFRSPQMNVGLLLGEPYGVTDIDLPVRPCRRNFLVWMFLVFRWPPRAGPHFFSAACQLSTMVIGGVDAWVGERTIRNRLPSDATS